MIICENCENEHDGSYGSGRFCSTKCSRGFSTKSKRLEINVKLAKAATGRQGWNKGMKGKCSEETLQKLSASSKKYWESLNIGKENKILNDQKNYKKSKNTERNISNELKTYWSSLSETEKYKRGESVRNLGGKLKFKKCKICNDDKEILHFSRLCEECKDDFRAYKEKCSFLFNVYNYPDKFDIALIEKYGWYSPKNSKKVNLNGISRDHILSVSDGYKKNIDPSIISHPANCMIMRHSENQKKWSKSNMTYDELVDKINSW